MKFIVYTKSFDESKMQLKLSKIFKIFLVETNRAIAAKIKFAIIKLSITSKFNKFAFIDSNFSNQ